MKISDFSSTSKSYVSQATINKKVVNFIVDCNVPSTVVRAESFKEVVLLGLPGKKVPAYQTMMEQMMRDYEELKAEIKKMLFLVKFVVCTADLWTGGYRGWMGMTVHWLSYEDLSRVSFTLACRRVKGRHTFDVIAKVIFAILQDFGIQNKTSWMVTDSASNFIKAFVTFKGDDEEDNRENKSDESETEEEEGDEESSPRYAH